MGFSAGGHLAATAATHFDAGHASSSAPTDPIDPTNPTDPVDPIEQQSSRPDFLVLAYPVITMDAAFTHAGSRRMLLGDDPDPALVHLLSNELQVTANTPPTFIFSTTDDPVVPVMNSVMFYSALVKAGVPAEMHLFQNGQHGSGLGQASPTLKAWPGLLLSWLQANRWAAPNVPVSNAPVSNAPASDVPASNVPASSSAH